MLFCCLLCKSYFNHFKLPPPKEYYYNLFDAPNAAALAYYVDFSCKEITTLEQLTLK